MLVAVVILVIVAGILLPWIIHTRRAAATTGQKFDFQAIDAALSAYHEDFGDYPRNNLLPTWNSMQNGADGPPTPAPVFYPLAAALLGPGPAVTRTVGGELQTGDGSDGPGFRCQKTRFFAGSVSAEAGNVTITVAVDPSGAVDAAAFSKDFATSESKNPTLASVTLFPTLKQPFQETIGIGQITSAGDKLCLTLLTAPCYPHDGRCEVSVVGGKVWGPYLAGGTFKVTVVPSVDAYGAPFAGFGQAMLLDHWGQVIEYFPRDGPPGNRLKDSVNPPDDSVQAGPLFGYSQPKSVDPTNGANAIWDWRDGCPFFTISGQIGPAQSWPNPSGTPKSFRPELALQWMLGDSGPQAGFKNEIPLGGKLRYDGPYILISVGPDGPERSNGGFCNFTDANFPYNPLPWDRLESEFIRSGNIYNFDRP